MGTIIIEVSVLLLVIGFLVFLAIDDRRNQKLRALEDQQKAGLEQQSSGSNKPPRDNR